MRDLTHFSVDYAGVFELARSRSRLGYSYSGVIFFLRPLNSGFGRADRIDRMNIICRIKRFVHKGSVPPIAVILLLAPHCVDASGKIDHSRAGEMLLRHEIGMMEEWVYPYATVEAYWLPVVNISAMGRAFGVRPAAIRKFRWGRSLAPRGHNLAESVWYTIWHQGEGGATTLRRTTLRVGVDGRVIEKFEW